MEIATRKFPHFLLGLAFIAFLWVAFLGMSWTIMGMEMDKNGQMGGCPFLGFTAVCKMSPLEHIVSWQKMFTALPLKNISILTTLLLLAIFSVFFLQDLWSKNSLQAISIHSQRFRYGIYVIRHKLKEAFSNGILNPKVF